MHTLPEHWHYYLQQVQTHVVFAKAPFSERLSSCMQVRNLRGLRNRTTDGLPWVLECGFLIYAVIDVPGDHMEELQQVIQRKLCDSSVHEAHMRRYRHTWQRVLTLLSLPSDVSSHERERLEKGDLCQRVRTP